MRLEHSETRHFRELLALFQTFEKRAVGQFVSCQKRGEDDGGGQQHRHAPTVRSETAAEQQQDGTRGHPTQRNAEIGKRHPERAVPPSGAEFGE